jgi:hypothetical protein
MTHVITVPSVKTVLTNEMIELQKIKTLKVELIKKKRKDENNKTPQNTGHCLPSTWFVAAVIKIAALELMM